MKNILVSLILFLVLLQGPALAADPVSTAETTQPCLQADPDPLESITGRIQMFRKDGLQVFLVHRQHESAQSAAVVPELLGTSGHVEGKSHPGNFEGQFENADGIRDQTVREGHQCRVFPELQGKTQRISTGSRPDSGACPGMDAVLIFHVPTQSYLVDDCSTPTLPGPIYDHGVSL